MEQAVPRHPAATRETLRGRGETISIVPLDPGGHTCDWPKVLVFVHGQLTTCRAGHGHR